MNAILYTALPPPSSELFQRSSIEGYRTEFNQSQFDICGLLPGPIYLSKTGASLNQQLGHLHLSSFMPFPLIVKASSSQHLFPNICLSPFRALLKFLLEASSSTMATNICIVLYCLQRNNTYILPNCAVLYPFYRQTY